MNEECVFHSPPKANVKFKFGEESNTFIVCYVKKPPNAFQRWMLRTLLGIYMELIND